jgi:Tol biopolymer transport system component
MTDLTQLERDVSAMLRDRAGADTRPPVAAGRVASRARRRRVINAATATAAVLLLVVGGTTALRSLGNDEVLPPPAVPITPHHNGLLLTTGSPELLAVSADGTVAPFPLAGASLQSRGSTVWALRWSPDGARLAFLAGGLSLNSENDTVALYVADADGSNVRKLTRCPEIYSCGVALTMSGGLAWSPDGRSIAFASGHLYVVDVANGARRRLPAGERVLAPAWSPDGSVVAVATPNGQAWQVRTVPADADGDDTSTITTLVAGLPAVDSLDWSPDGTRLVMSAADGLHMVDANGDNASKIVSQDSDEGPGAATWSPDGTRIAYFTTPKSPGRFAAELRTFDPDTRHDQSLLVAPCCVSTWHPPAWSPDGTRIALSVEIIGHPDRTGLFLVPTGSPGDAVRIPMDGLPGLPAWQPLP